MEIVQSGLTYRITNARSGTVLDVAGDNISGKYVLATLNLTERDLTRCCSCWEPVDTGRESECQISS